MLTLDLLDTAVMSKQGKGKEPPPGRGCCCALVVHINMITRSYVARTESRIDMGHCEA